MIVSDCSRFYIKFFASFICGSTFPEAAGANVVPSTTPVSGFKQQSMGKVSDCVQDVFAGSGVVCAYQHLEKML